MNDDSYVVSKAEKTKPPVFHSDPAMNKHMRAKAQQSVKWAAQNKKQPSEAYGHWVKSVDTKKHQEAHNKKYNIKPGDDDYYEPDNTWPWTESVGDAEGSEEGWKYMHANVSKSAFGVEHGEEIAKLANPFSAVGRAISAVRKPAAAGKHANAVMSTAQRAGNIARNAPKPGQTSAARLANTGTKPPTPSPRVTNPVAPAAKPPAAASTNVAPSAGTQTIHLNNGNAGPTPKGGSKSKGGGKNKGGQNGGFVNWAKTNSLSRNLAIGAGVGGVGAMGYGAAKIGDNR